jgi:hypothetical protein
LLWVRLNRGVTSTMVEPLVLQVRFVYNLIMSKSAKKVIPKRKPGTPATGKDPVRAFRLSDEFMARLDTWALTQEDQPSRSEALRRLAELGLRVKAK